MANRKKLTKPDFRRVTVWTSGGGCLTEAQRKELFGLLPDKLKSATTRDRMQRTDAARIVNSLDEALGGYDASQSRASAAGSEIVAGVEAIGAAAASLLIAIRDAGPAARKAIDDEAFYYRTGASGGADTRLSTTGNMCVDWYSGLCQSGLSRIAEWICADGPREFSQHEKSLLSRLWDLAEDAGRMAQDAPLRIERDRNLRPGRENAKLFARLAVSSFAARSNMGKLPPTSAWYSDLVIQAAKYRDLTIGKSTVLTAIAALNGKEDHPLD